METTKDLIRRFREQEKYASFIEFLNHLENQDKCYTCKFRCEKCVLDMEEE